MSRKNSTGSTGWKLPRADKYLLGITVIWGSTFTISKVALEDVSPFELQAVRFAIAAVIVGMYTWRDIKATTRTSLKAGLILGVFLGLGFALQTVGLVTTTASRAGFLTGTMVVFTPLLQLLIERRMPTPGNLIGVVLVAIGLYVFSSPAGGTFGSGDLLVLGCAVVFAFYIVYLDVFTKDRFDREIVFYQFVATACIGAGASFVFPSAKSNFSPTVLYAVLYLAIFASVIALMVQSKYQRETTPTKAAIIFTMEPVFAALIAFMLLGETMGTEATIGAGIMFAGLLCSEVYTAMAGARKKH